MHKAQRRTPYAQSTAKDSFINLMAVGFFVPVNLERRSLELENYAFRRCVVSSIFVKVSHLMAQIIARLI